MIRSIVPLKYAVQLTCMTLVFNLAWNTSYAQSSWQNPANRLDVNNDGFAAADDAIVVFNEINSPSGLLGELPTPATAPPFYDVSGNGFLEPLDGFLIITELNQSGSPVPGNFTATDSGLVDVRLEVVNDSDAAIDSVRIGERFTLNAVVTDKSQNPSSVFASYFDVTYDPTRVSVAGDPTFGEVYANGQRFDAVVDGVVAGIGAIAGPRPHGEESLLFSLPFQADQTGEVGFGGDANGAFSLVFGIDTSVVTEFRGATIQVVPEPTGGLLLVSAICLLALSFKRSKSC